ncbi:MAG: hypothetical protein A2583_12335 [Bdellovibrionales bacterium RIFOXYD1_FULL_53_11]|nr:MAG: hypothetical protein A2583_12335 [Bdellovibrionales bacterium RIFOXYD1_FULL_53_11]
MLFYNFIMNTKPVRMMAQTVLSNMVLLGALSGALSPPSAHARSPIPIPDIYEDGYVAAVWNFRNDEAKALKTMKRIAATGAKRFIIPYFGCQKDVTSSAVGTCEVKMPVTPAFLAKMAALAGMKPSYLPLVITPDWKWRGYFKPDDVDEWFKSYTGWLVPIAREAQRLGMRELVAGTEFSILYKYENKWRELVRTLRKTFTGAILVTVNWDDINHNFWDEFDAIGMSAYFPLSRVDNPPQEELDKAWRKKHRELLKHFAKWQRPIEFTEVGYPSVPHAARTPWASPSKDSPQDLALQARCFEAFRKAWHGEKNLARLTVWATGDPSSQDARLGFETIGKPAEKSISRFFEERSHLR